MASIPAPSGGRSMMQETRFPPSVRSTFRSCYSRIGATRHCYDCYLQMLSPGTQLGPYEIQSLLGAGGMGEVYRARDARLNRTVALKILPSQVAADPGRRQRFEQEARAASAL